MTSSAGVSVRSLLAAGMAATAVGAIALTPVTAPERTVTLASPAVALTSIGTDIKAFYDAVEPWAAYGAEVATYALGFVPGLWWVAPGIDLAYFTIEPLVQAGVYSVADLIDLDFAQIPIDINAGINESLDNFVTFGLAWIGSLVPIPPLPPLPPLPPFPGASVSNPAAASRAATRVASLPDAEAVTAAETAETDAGAATDATAAPVVETVAPAEAVATTVAVEVEASSPKRQSSRATRTARTAAGVAAPAAAQSAPENAVAAEPDGSAAAASTGASGKAKAARASRGAGRAG